MKKFNKSFNTDTTYVKFFGSKQFHKVSNINDTRVNIQVAGLGGSFQRGHVEKFTNKIKNAPSPRIPHLDNETLYMNPATGTVQSLSDWIADYHNDASEMWPGVLCDDDVPNVLEPMTD